MGASESSVIGVSGFQIARVLPNSPAHVAGLCPFFDFITEVDGIALSDDGGINFLKKYIADNINKTLRLTVFNLRVRTTRQTELLPCDGWGGVGLFGCVLEWNTADNALESPWHVVDLVEGSPADRCGDIMAQRDYLLGMEASDRSLVLFGPHSTSSDLRDMVTSSLSHGDDVLVLLVFDSVNNAIKEVSIPMCGINTMGIDVADGYLHFIPAVVSSDPLDMIRKLPCVTQFQRRDDGPASPVATSPRPVEDEVITVQSVPPPVVPPPSTQPTAPHSTSVPVQKSAAPVMPSMHNNTAPKPPHPPPSLGALPFPSFPLPPRK